MCGIHEVVKQEDLVPSCPVSFGGGYGDRPYIDKWLGVATAVRPVGG